MPKEQQTNGYSYGPSLLPISELLDKDTKFQEEKNLRLLGFVDKKKIPRESLMSEVEMVVPKKGQDNLFGQKMFTALVYSMLSLNKYALARYVPRNNKNGVVPRMVVLIPHRTANREGLHLIDLPTVEDVRDYPFNPLKESTEAQKELVKQQVANMMLYRKNDQEEEEFVKIENTFNPTRQYFYEAVFFRALN